MSQVLKAAVTGARTSLGSVLKKTGATSAVRSQLRTMLQNKLAGRGAKGAPLPFGRRRRRRGISATELRGFRKVASMLSRYFAKAPAAMKRRGFRGRGR
jgi:hypothetical protein